MNGTVVVLGAGGQLGRELLQTVPADVTCVGLGHDQLDITDAGAVARRMSELTPAQVINAAAYTAVDAAESDRAAAERLNTVAPGQLAAVCAEQDIRLLHVSTDFVFDGKSSRPYTPDASTAPLGVYGRSKRDGELAVLKELPQALIVRTAWLYSGFGGNFVQTMLRLMREREELGVVADQVGTPTWARGLARALWAAVARPQLTGIYHWSDAGVCSWYDFAVAILEEAAATGLVENTVRVQPVTTQDYPTPAQRPAYSVLDKSASWRDLGLEGVHWRCQLRAMLTEQMEREHG